MHCPNARARKRAFPAFFLRNGLHRQHSNPSGGTRSPADGQTCACRGAYLRPRPGKGQVAAREQRRACGADRDCRQSFLARPCDKTAATGDKYGHRRAAGRMPRTRARTPDDNAAAKCCPRIGARVVFLYLCKTDRPSPPESQERVFIVRRQESIRPAQ